MFRRARLLSLLSVVVLPYLLDKLESRYRNAKEELLVDPGCLSSTWKRHFVSVYPKLCSLVKWLKMFNYMCYVFGYTGYGNPVLYLTRMQIKYGTKIPEQLRGGVGDDAGDQILMMRFLKGLSTLLSSMVTRMVPFLLHSLQFADMFYQKDMLSTVASTLMSVSKPPQMPKVRSPEL